MITLTNAETLNDTADYCDQQTDIICTSVEQGDLDKASRVIQDLVQSLEHYWGKDIKRMEKAGSYFNFGHPLEQLIYMHLYPSTKTIIKVQAPLATIYQIHAHFAAVQGHHKEALAIIKRARRWNPVNIYTAIEHARILILTGKRAAGHRVICEATQYATSPTELAMCYRFLADDYIDQRNWEMGISLLACSNVYDANHPHLQSSLDFIDAQINGAIPTPIGPEVVRDKYHIPITPNMDLFKIATEQRRLCEENGDARTVQYYDDFFEAWNRTTSHPMLR